MARRWIIISLLGLSLTLLVAWLALGNSLMASTDAGQTTLVSVSSGGEQGNHYSFGAAISADGRYVAFFSTASNLVPGDTNGFSDIFVHDRQTGQTTRVSVSSGGDQGNYVSVSPAISADGRYVAFESHASNLVPGDTNGFSDIFVHDRQTGQTTRVSVSSGGEQGNHLSNQPAIAANGRYVGFTSRATNLVPGDTSYGYMNYADVFVHDRQTGQTTRVSVSSGGEQGDGDSWSVSRAISADGRYVAFMSDASNLVPDDTNGEEDVFVHDRQTGQTTRVSVSSGGEQGDYVSGSPAISADGRYVAFKSQASNLVPGDTNGFDDVFVHDRQTGQTTRVSVSSGGEQGNLPSFIPVISADGRYVAFMSDASNLVPDDTNGEEDVFVHDRQTGQTTRVSVSSGGEQGDSWSGEPAISADGRYLAFSSVATNLVPNDTNGSTDIFVHDRLGAGSPTATPTKTLTPPPATATATSPAPTATATATPFPVSAISIDFRLDWDAYSFENYSFPLFTDYSKADMVLMFGEEDICAAYTPGQSDCTINEPATRWYADNAIDFPSGRCFGMTTTALRFLNHLERPSQFHSGALTVYAIDKRNIRRHLGWHQALQYASNIRNSIKLYTPNEVLERVYRGLQQGNLELLNLHVARRDYKSGHVVLPYAIEAAGDHKWRIMVYDNNWPNDSSRFVMVDTAANTFSTNLGIPPENQWTGDANSYNIGVVPLSVLIQQPKCPWCNDDQNKNDRPLLTLNSTGFDDLLISDSNGARIGYVGSQFINEIPHASAMPSFDGTGVAKEPDYLLPQGGQYTIEITGNSTRSATSGNIALFGPGFVAGVDSVPLSINTRDSLSLTSDGKEIGYKASEAKEVELFLSGGQNATQGYMIKEAVVGANQSIKLLNDTVNGQLIVDYQDATSGAYTLVIRDVTSVGESYFAHSDIPILAGEAHLVQLNTLSNDSVELCSDVDGDGSPENCEELENRFPAITAFTPTTGSAGTSVTIAGTNLADATGVTFNGTAAAFSVDSAMQITAVVPVGAETGKITVTTPIGSATNDHDFTVMSSSTYSSYLPFIFR